MDKEQQRERILSLPKPLSPNQRRAVLSNKRHIRIIAGAGAGKTETLTRRIVYHLIYEEVDPAAIVAFTFTDKAAQGMKSRIYDRLKDMGRDDLRGRIGDLYVGTIHGYCYRLLTDYFNYGNHDVFDENQERAFLSIVAETWASSDSGNYISNCKNFLETVKVVERELILNKLSWKSPGFLEAPILVRNLQFTAVTIEVPFTYHEPNGTTKDGTVTIPGGSPAGTTVQATLDAEFPEAVKILGVYLCRNPEL